MENMKEGTDLLDEYERNKKDIHNQVEVKAEPALSDNDEVNTNSADMIRVSVKNMEVQQQESLDSQLTSLIKSDIEMKIKTEPNESVGDFEFVKCERPLDMDDDIMPSGTEADGNYDKDRYNVPNSHLTSLIKSDIEMKIKTELNESKEDRMFVKCEPPLDIDDDIPYSQLTSLIKSDIEMKVKTEPNESVGDFEFVKCERPLDMDDDMPCDTEADIKDDQQKYNVPKTDETGTQVVDLSLNVKTVSESSLQQQMRIHTGEKPYKCGICDYKTKRPRDLKRHMGTHTVGERHKCDVCDYETVHSARLKRHLRTHIELECDFCDYETVHSTDLKHHMRTHTGEKPYKCGICDYEGARPTDLKFHMRAHTGEKPFKCNVCNFKSARPDGLKCHMRTHTGEKPYECGVCDYKAARSYAYKLHMRTHHS